MSSIKKHETQVVSLLVIKKLNFFFDRPETSQASRLLRHMLLKSTGIRPVTFAITRRNTRTKKTRITKLSLAYVTIWNSSNKQVQKNIKKIYKTTYKNYTFNSTCETYATYTTFWQFDLGPFGYYFCFLFLFFSIIILIFFLFLL